MIHENVNFQEAINSFVCISKYLSCIHTGERGWLVESAVLVVEIGGAVARTEGRGRSQDELLFDDAGFGVVFRQFCQTLLQRVPQEV